MAKMRKRDLSFAVRVTSCGESNHSRARVEAEAILVSVGWGRRPGFPSVATLTVKDRLTRRRFRLQLPVEDLQRAAAYIKETDKRMSERGIIGPYWEDQS